MTATRTGPLAGRRIIEIAGIGPGPFCGMMLADHGAEVIRIERPGGTRAGSGGAASLDPLQRSRRSLVADLKTEAGIDLVKALVERSDGLIEGFRPGVMERLGLGPDVLLSVNPRLVYGRITGWGQDGPWASLAGHDINYVALSGTLHALGEAGGRPIPPINLVADFGGGGMLLAFGMLAAMLEAERSGKGQVVDAAMTEGSALLMSMIWGFRAQGRWSDERGTNALDGGTHYYDTYETADGKFVALGAVENQFYALLGKGLGLEPGELDEKVQRDPLRWPELKAKIANLVKSKPRAHWDEAFAGSDACYAPVLSFDEALAHPHNLARKTFGTHGGVTQPMPAPRYSRTATREPVMASSDADGGTALLTELGFSKGEVERYRARG